MTPPLSRRTIGQRFFIALCAVAAAASLPAVLTVPSCGTDAQSVDACKQVETARCEIAPSCSKGFDVESCTLFYRDACLVGIANPDAGDVSSFVDPCIASLKACAMASASTDPGCPGQALVDFDAGISCKDSNDKTLEPTPCNIVMHCPEVLAACSWVAKPPSTDTDGGTDGGDAGGGGSGGTGGGTGTGSGGGGSHTGSGGGGSGGAG